MKRGIGRPDHPVPVQIGVIGIKISKQGIRHHRFPHCALHIFPVRDSLGSFNNGLLTFRRTVSDPFQITDTAHPGIHPLPIHSFMNDHRIPGHGHICRPLNRCERLRRRTGRPVIPGHCHMIFSYHLHIQSPSYTSSIVFFPSSNGPHTGWMPRCCPK